MSNFEISFTQDSNDTAVDGYMSWSARGTQDGEIPPKNFFIKTSTGEKKIVNAIKKGGKGVIMDIHNMKMGWQRFGELGAEWVYNDDLKNWKPKPGDDYKQGLSIPCAIGEDKLVIFRQSGVGVMEGFRTLSSQLVDNKDINSGKLPVVTMTGTKEMKFKVGNTQVPQLTVIDYVDRPFVLEVEAAPTPSDADVQAAVSEF
jgi:hypothetical protein